MEGNHHKEQASSVGRCTLAQSCNSDCTQKPWYPQSRITDIPDTGPETETKKSEEEKEKIFSLEADLLPPILD